MNPTEDQLHAAFSAQRKALVDELLRAETNTEIRQILIDELNLRSGITQHKDVVRSALRIVQYFMGDNE